MFCKTYFLIMLSINFHQKWSTEMKKNLGLLLLLSSLWALPKELFEVKEDSNEKIVLSFKIEDYDIKKTNNFFRQKMCTLKNN